MKAKSSTFEITFFISIGIIILCIIGLAVTKNIIFAGFFVGIGIVPTIMMIVEIGSYIYHEKGN